MWYNVRKLTRKELAVEIESKVYVKQVDVAGRLSDLGLTEDLLLQALLFGFGYAAEGTRHDPANLAGLLIWGKTNRMLGDQLAPKGWTRKNIQNYPTTVHPSGAWAIAVAAGDERTGTGKTPATRTEKGPVTRRVVDQNQLSFALISPEFERPRRQTWLLLHRLDEETEELRAELSLPAEMTEDGFVTEWQERIVLSTASTSSTPATVADDSPSDRDAIDVPVRKKA